MLPWSTGKTVSKRLLDLNVVTAMADKYFDQEFVEYIIRGIVNNPNDVRT